MKNNITRDDLDVLIRFLQQEDPILTQSSNVKAFEDEWSQWLGVKYSVFVNSGASANLLTMTTLKQFYSSGEIIVPPLTWVSDIASVLQNGFDPVFVDINPRTLCMDDKQIISKITSKTRAVFITHVQGFNGLTDYLLDALIERNIPIIEDVCESHGATFKGKKLGAYGFISNFSFYYAHHMSTVEGGMVCTNDDNVYQILRMLRSHGMVRESNSEKKKQEYALEYPELNPEFIFAFPAYNVRNTEIGAVIGRNQLKRLDKNNKKRGRNLSIFLDCLDKRIFRTDFILDGSSNYAFPIILKVPDFQFRDRLENHMRNNGIEFRRGNAGGGNQMRQPYLKGIIQEKKWENYPEVEHIHHFGWYIGNFPDLSEENIVAICDQLNNT
ncbi:MAG: CDP-4-keto-6-deoxy-D-glucose-3-dehydrase [Candidatus Marinimicrobia bacterium]|nr:CDP-4-keto-6-deoxy-D-glucose-3-dehydrase [Candidatus Neomarinimicrobiota bacterium]